MPEFSTGPSNEAPRNGGFLFEVQMKVTPVSRKFGKYAPGDVFELKDKTAKLLIKVGKLREPDVVQAAPAYQTRMMQAESARTVPVDPLDYDQAPYGYKADGTPRLRPGRPAKSE